MSSNALSKIEQDKLERCEVVIKQGLETFIEVGRAFMSIRDERLYRKKYNTFDEYCKGRWGIKSRQAQLYMASAQVVENLNAIHGSHLPQNERQARPLSYLEPEIQREAWGEVVERHKENPERITAKEVHQMVEQWKPYNDEVKKAKRNSTPDVFNPTPKPIEEVVAEVVQKKKAHVSNNSGNNEWYTPDCYIESAKEVMGSIDLDPASSDVANQRVQAESIYTAETDGLKQKWYGNIWMNPPYAQPLIQHFCEKLTTEQYEQAIVLVNNATETKWGNLLLSISSAICFPKGRIRFISPDGSTGDSPLQGQMFAYIGDKTDAFINEFKQYGPCLKA